MTIHEMMHQIALLSAGRYAREGDVSTIEIGTPGNRTQVLYGREERMGEETVGLLYTYVGRISDRIAPMELLELNATLRYAKVTVVRGTDIMLLAMYDLIDTSVSDCAPMLQELAAVADDLEQRYFSEDAR